MVIEGPTHHGSVMFRREAYVKAGGYRAAFYYAQDWDLWYRLAALGKFAMVGQCVVRARITPGSISSLSRIDKPNTLGFLTRPLRFGFLATLMPRSCRKLSDFFHASHTPSKIGSGPALYFIGRCLVDNNDPRATRYIF